MGERAIPALPESLKNLKETASEIFMRLPTYKGHVKDLQECDFAETRDDYLPLCQLAVVKPVVPFGFRGFLHCEKTKTKPQ